MTAMSPFRPCAGRGPASLFLVVNLLPRLSLFLLYALYLSLVLCRANLHELPVGHVPAGNRVCRTCVERRSDAGHMAVALAAVPLHVHVGRRQAVERRSQLVEPVGAVISLSDAAAAHAASVARRAAAARPIEGRRRRHVFRRADSAVPYLLLAPAAVF